MFPANQCTAGETNLLYCCLSKTNSEVNLMRLWNLNVWWKLNSAGSNLKSFILKW